MKKIEIISRGRCVEVSEAQIVELRGKNISWLAYCQKRLTKGHDAAVHGLTK